MIGGLWRGFLGRRLVRLVVSLWVLVTASFLMIRLIPGDPVRAALGPMVAQSVVDARRADLGLDLPLPLQYLQYFHRLFTGDLGSSMVSGSSVSDTIAQRLPATLQLALLAFLAAVVIAIPLGLITAVLTRAGRRRGIELGFTATTSVLAAIPEFFVAVVLVSIFAVSLRMLPVAGRVGPESFVLPVISLALAVAMMLARIVRVEVLSVLENDFVRTARAKRLRPRRIYLRHAFPNALTSTLTIGGLALGSMVVGGVLVENVFAWPGLGMMIVSAILAKDYPVVQGLVLVYGGLVLVINFLVDIALAVADPRSTLRESS